MRRTLLNAAAATPAQDVVRQNELQAAIDLFAQSGAACRQIRHRLEAGAVLELGKLGVSTVGEGPLKDGEPEVTEIDGVFCLTIAPKDDLQFEVELVRQHGRQESFVLGVALEPLAAAPSVEAFQLQLDKNAGKQAGLTAADRNLLRQFGIKG